MLWKTKKHRDGSITWETWPPFDIDKAKKELDPHGRGQGFAFASDGVGDEQSLTDDEIQLLAPLNIHIASLREWFNRVLGAMKDEINEICKDADTRLSFDRVVLNFDSARRVACEEYQIQQEKDYADRELALRELRAFQSPAQNNLLTRGATYPESRMLHFAIVAAAMVGESVANAYFFGQASDAGLLGGFTTAFLVSLANVGFSMLAGFMFLRELNHVKLWRKVAGGLAFAFSLILLGFLHLAIAHYRENLVRNPDVENFFSVLPHLWGNPFGLQDLESILLITIGIVISAIGVWKGYTLDDPYPGYGAVFRRWKELDDRVDALEADLKRDIGKAYDASVQGTQQVLSNISVAKNQLVELEGDIEACFRCCEDYYLLARKGAVALVSAFRSEVHIVLGDQDRFPFSEGLLDKPGGLEKLDPTEGRDELVAIYEKKLSEMESAIEKFPEEQRLCLDEMEEKRVRYTSASAIKKIMAEIEEKRKLRDPNSDYQKQVAH